MIKGGKMKEEEERQKFSGSNVKIWRQVAARKLEIQDFLRRKWIYSRSAQNPRKSTALPVLTTQRALQF